MGNENPIQPCYLCKREIVMQTRKHETETQLYEIQTVLQMLKLSEKKDTEEVKSAAPLEPAAYWVENGLLSKAGKWAKGPKKK